MKNIEGKRVTIGHELTSRIHGHTGPKVLVVDVGESTITLKQDFEGALAWALSAEEFAKSEWVVSGFRKPEELGT